MIYSITFLTQIRTENFNINTFLALVTIRNAQILICANFGPHWIFLTLQGWRWISWNNFWNGNDDKINIPNGFHNYAADILQLICTGQTPVLILKSFFKLWRQWQLAHNREFITSPISILFTRVNHALFTPGDRRKC